MADVYYVGNVTDLGKSMGAKPGNTDPVLDFPLPTKYPLEQNVYYAYIDGYTSDRNGSQQGTGLGYLVKVVFRFGVPSVEKRIVNLMIGVYFCRKDYVGSNNTLSVSMVANNIETKYSNLIAMTTEWKVTAKRAVTLNYSDDGTAATTIKVTGSNNTGTCSSITCTFNVTAPQIAAKPKASKLTLSSNRLTIGSTKLTLTHDSVTDVYTDIFADIMGSDGKTVVSTSTIATINSSKTVTWTPSASVANNLPDRSSASGRIRCVTYERDGSVKGAKVGTKTYPVTFIVPSTYKVGIKSLTISDASGNATNGNGYKIGTSVIKATLVLDTSKAYGSYIEKASFGLGNELKVIEKVDITGDTVVCTASKPITSSSPAITVEVRDSRGMTTLTTAEISAANNVTAPSITMINVGRGNGTTIEGWTNDEGGSNCRLKYTAVSRKIQDDIAAGRSGSSISIKIQYKKIDGVTDSFTTFSYTTPDNNTGVVSGDLVIPLNDSDNAYVIRVTATDSVGSKYRDANISTGFSLFEISKSGKGISIGCPATGDNENRFTVAMETKFTGKVYNSTGGVAITSDERKKDEIKPLESVINEELLIDLFKLDPIIFKYKDSNDDVNHFGFSANKFYDVFTKHDIDPKTLSILEEIEETNNTTKIVERFLTMRYEELTPIMFLMIKNILLQLINIDNRLKEIEEKWKKE